MQFTSQSQERGWGIFSAGWPGEVLHYVVEVWESLRFAASLKREPRITNLLAGAICAKYEAEGRDWFVIPEVKDWDTAGKEVSRTDLRFYPPGAKRRVVCFVFESKCLNTPASNAGKYAGKDGMQCFITGKYSAGMPCGGMLGYVMDADMARAHSAVCKAIRNKRKQLRLSPDGDYRSSSIAPKSKWHGETKHQLPDRVFTIFHLLLKVVRS
jgi:hypothetical protein